MCIYVYVFLFGVIGTSTINIALYTFRMPALAKAWQSLSEEVGWLFRAYYLEELDFQCRSSGELPDAIDPGVNMTCSIVHARALD